MTRRPRNANQPRKSLALLGALTATCAVADAQPIHFTDKAATLGVLDLSFGRGTAFVDLNLDGRLDIADANAGMRNTIYAQLSSGSFQDVTSLWGGDTSSRETFGVLAADFDNDGDDDLFYVNGGFGTGVNALFRNDLPAGGKLVEVGEAAGSIATAVASWHSGTALDFDNDGRLDIFINRANGEGGSLFRNLGGLSFADVTAAAGISQSYGEGRHCGIIDYDDDGLWDILAAHAGHDTQLYRNNGDGTFTDVAVQAGITAHGSSLAHWGAVADDLDNDGLMDVVIAVHNNFSTPPTPVYLNRGDGTFQLVSTPASGMGAQTDMGYTTADLDMDGYPDYWSGTGSPHISGAKLNVLYRVLPDGQGGLQFTDISSVSGIEASGPSRSHGSAVGDFDRDGDLDLYQNDGGPSSNASSIETNSLWASDGNGNHWLQVDLTGKLSNRTAVGARLAADLGTRTVHRYVSVGKGFCNTDAHTVHMGLGTSNQIEALVIRWPSGIVQTVEHPPADSFVDVVETGLRLSGAFTPGGAATLSACGPDGAPMLLLGSSTTGQAAIPGIQGDLLLGLPFAFAVGAALPADGVMHVPFVVPNDPGLVGVQFHFQAVVVSPGGPAFTNAVTIAIS